MKYKFEVGDKVVYTNEFGRCWGVKTITELGERRGQPVYQHEPTDTPWSPVEEARYTLADEDDLLAHEHGQTQYLQFKHGRPATKEELASLLDGDPFDGET